MRAYPCTRSRHGNCACHRRKLIFNTVEIDFYHRGNWFLPPLKIDFLPPWKLNFTTVENWLEIDFFTTVENWFLPPWKIDFFPPRKLNFTIKQFSTQLYPTYLQCGKICRVGLYHPYLVSMLFADLLSLHLVTFLMFLILVLVDIFLDEPPVDVKITVITTMQVVPNI